MSANQPGQGDHSGGAGGGAGGGGGAQAGMGGECDSSRNFENIFLLNLLKDKSFDT